MHQVNSRIRLLTLYGLALLPIIIWGAAHALQSSNNSPIDWVDSSFEQRKQYDHFVELFGPGDAVLASWPECFWTDERLDALIRELRTSPRFRAADGSAYFTQVTCGREVLLQMTGSSEASESTTTSVDSLVPDEADDNQTVDDPATSERSGGSRIGRMPISKAIQRLKGTLIGKDGRTTTVVVILNKDGLIVRAKLVEEIRQSIDEIFGIDPKDLHLAGPVVDGLTVDAAAHSSLTKFAGPSALVIFVICCWSLRSLLAGIVVFLTASLCQGIILAVIYYSGQQLSALLIILPPLVQVLAVSSGIHLMNYYQNALETMEPREAAIDAFRKGWLPSILSLGTTAMGTASLMISRLEPIRLFGVYGTVGVLTASASVLTIIPCSMMIIGRRRASQQSKENPNFAARQITSAQQSSADANNFVWHRLARFLSVHNTVAVATLLGIMLVAAAGLPWLKTSIRIETLFASNSRIMQDYRWLEDRIGPLVPIEVLVSFDSDCRLNDRLRMDTLWRVNDVLLKQPHVRSATSALTFFPEMPPLKSFSPAMRSVFLNKAIHTARPAFESMGVLRTTEKNELWRITAHVSSLDPLDYGDVLEDIELAVNEELFPPNADSRTRANQLAGVQVLTSGIMPLVHEIQGQLLSDLFYSLMSALIVITLTMTIVEAGFLSGLVAMTCNLFPVTIAFGVMGLLDHPMDIGSVMTASIALGIAVDDTLHFLAFFRRTLHQPGATRFSAIVSGYHHCGRAMIQTSVSCGLGLLVFAFSDFVPTSRFAILIAGLLMLALLGDLLLLPALLLSPAGKLFEPGAEFLTDKPENRLEETEPESVGEWQTQMARANDAEWAER